MTLTINALTKFELVLPTHNCLRMDHMKLIE